MKIINIFLGWYNKNYRFNLRFAVLLFLLQLVHLFWLTGNVVLFRLLGISIFPPQLDWILAVIDYTEIPALISVSMIYINEIIIRKNRTKAWIYLLLLNSQWLHLLWITDEVVLSTFTGHSIISIPIWLAWIAILIDYLELPVMYDTAMKMLRLKKENV